MALLPTCSASQFLGPTSCQRPPCVEAAFQELQSWLLLEPTNLHRLLCPNLKVHHTTSLNTGSMSVNTLRQSSVELRNVACDSQLQPWQKNMSALVDLVVTRGVQKQSIDQSSMFRCGAFYKYCSLCLRSILMRQVPATACKRTRRLNQKCFAHAVRPAKKSTRR